MLSDGTDSGNVVRHQHKGQKAKGWLHNSHGKEKTTPPRKHNQESNQKIPINNSFHILNRLPIEEEMENPHKKDNQDKDKGKSKL